VDSRRFRFEGRGLAVDGWALDGKGATGREATTFRGLVRFTVAGGKSSTSSVSSSSDEAF